MKSRFPAGLPRIGRTVVLLLLLLGSSCAHAQEITRTSESRLLASCPFTTFTGGVVVVRVRIGDFPDTLNFILDTGSGGISLDSMTCDRLHLQPVESDKVVLGIAGARHVKFLYNMPLYIGNLKVDSLNFHINDYDMLSSVYGDKIDGIMGYSFFSRYIVGFDYDSNVVRVYSRGKFRYPRGGYLLKPQFLVNLPVQGAHVRDAAAGSSARFYFDMGAGLCVLFSREFLEDSVLFSPSKKYFSTQAQGLGGKAEMRMATLKEFKLGPYKFRNIPVHAFDDEYNVTSYPYLGGLIGNDILRRFNVILNYEKHDLYLVPNTHYHDPFDYSYTGLGLYWIDGQVRVGDVMAGSPADKAGFRVDDIILSLEDNKSRNLNLYKTMMQTPGQRLKFVVEREGVVATLLLRVQSIL